MSTLRLVSQEPKKQSLTELFGGGWRVFTKAYWLESADKTQVAERKREKDQQQVDNIALTFFIAAIAAKLAKVDSPLKKVEIDAFRETFNLPQVYDELSVEEAFREALKDEMDATHYAKRIASFHPANKEMLEELVDALFKFAGMDAALNPKEIMFIKNVVLALGFNEEEFRRILRCHTIPHYRSHYDALGVTKNVSAEELKKAYRKTVQYYHPDKFSDKNIPAELVAIAQENFRMLTDAYDAIRIKHRFR